MKYTEREKILWWNRMVAEKGRPYGMTNKRLEITKKLVWNEEDFWFNTIGRNRLDNFWGMLLQTAVEHGIIKP